uniref:Protein kinase domain-containing protein n=1 Tax=Kalanchoe fedtschenkoi TaxID=63787 RepID=A0A7N0TSI9_KALFE
MVWSPPMAAAATVISGHRDGRQCNHCGAIFRTLSATFSLLAFSLIVVYAGATVEDDVMCLRGIQASLSDPDRRLSRWRLDNTSSSSTAAAPFICDLYGVSCWNEKENRLISLSLPSISLSGKLPESLKYCRSLQTLDLSGNSLSGSIPPQICSWLPYLVTLDLSNNRLSGSIPAQIGDCKFLNTLLLSRNRLTGPIPPELGQLDRLKRLSLAANRLAGPIPAKLVANFTAADFDGNGGLCGPPLGLKCGGLGRKGLGIVVTAGVIGAAASLILGFVIWWWCFVRAAHVSKACDLEVESWVEKLRGFRLVQVTLFHKPVVKIKLADLLAATASFGAESVLISNRTGVLYKAELGEDSASMVLGVKRLAVCKLSEKQFRSEMYRLGQLQHPNLVPLLGFCVAEDEKLLVYKHMANGTLHSHLHPGGERKRISSLDWVGRVRIGLGAARGLAWLHHVCDPPYIHQNISSNAILLDEKFDARITDHGLVKLIGSGDSTNSSFVNGKFGELGHVAPEYSSTMVASLKGDVYSFGVVLLELVTGQNPIDLTRADDGFRGNLVDWISKLSAKNRVQDAVDERLTGGAEKMMQVMKIACSCVAQRPKDRPSMHNVYTSLASVAEELEFYEEYRDFPSILQEEDAAV